MRRARARGALPARLERRGWRAERGLTLLEVLVGVAIFGLLIAFGGTVAQSVLTASRASMARQDISARIAGHRHDFLRHYGTRLPKRSPLPRGFSTDYTITRLRADGRTETLRYQTACAPMPRSLSSSLYAIAARGGPKIDTRTLLADGRSRALATVCRARQGVDTDTLACPYGQRPVLRVTRSTPSAKGKGKLDVVHSDYPNERTTDVLAGGFCIRRVATATWLVVFGEVALIGDKTAPLKADVRLVEDPSGMDGYEDGGITLLAPDASAKKTGPFTLPKGKVGAKRN
jgi:prepilin-type N-terminal cleavage/methylation domain-containing protein